MISESVSTTFGEAQTFASRRTIPFDYAFRYVLTGSPGTVLNSTVTVSIEAAFVAVSIGYGVIPDVTPITFGPTLQQIQIGLPTPVLANRIRLRDITLAHLLDSLRLALDEVPGRIGPQTGTVLTNGVKLNPAFAVRALGDNGNALLEEEILTSLFQVIGAPPEHIQFLYAIFDEGSGREFQSDPILNIAGLGISDGDRPFRYFAQPITFSPRATIRIEVREVSNFKGQLHVSLHGYKVLGGVGTPTGRIRQGRVRGRRR